MGEQVALSSFFFKDRKKKNAPPTIKNTLEQCMAGWRETAHR